MRVEVIISVNIPEVNSSKKCEKILNDADFTVKSSDGKELDIEILDYDFDN